VAGDSSPGSDGRFDVRKGALTKAMNRPGKAVYHLDT
jgi:hypothetical protein